MLMLSIKQDKYKAVWMSHSAIGDYEKCERLYYLHNIYKNKSGKKINIVSPYMSLGIAVHNVLEDLRNYKSEERLKINLLENFEKEWVKYHGKIGGFKSDEEELEFKERGTEMIRNVMSDFKMLASKTIPLKSYYDGDMLPNYYISEEENIILCGNIDWIEYSEGNNSLVLIDFKTGKNEEKEDSMQLPIYKLLLTNLQKKWKVGNGKYWYLDNGLVADKVLDDKLLEEVKNKIIRIGIEIRDKKYEWKANAKFGRAGWVEHENMEKNFSCTSKLSNINFCDCKKYEKIVSGDTQAEYVGTDMYGKDAYFIDK
jgi:ATP-dependent helicase/DNAse subunit B